MNVLTLYHRMVRFPTENLLLCSTHTRCVPFKFISTFPFDYSWPTEWLMPSSTAFIYNSYQVDLFYRHINYEPSVIFGTYYDFLTIVALSRESIKDSPHPFTIYIIHACVPCELDEWKMHWKLSERHQASIICHASIQQTGTRERLVIRNISSTLIGTN